MKKILNIIVTAALLTVTGASFAPVNCYAVETATEETTEIEQNISDLVASDDEKAPAQKVGKEGMVPVYGTDVVDGTYAVEVDSSSSMFRIVKAELTVSEGEMTAVITLSGKGYIKLFMGTGVEAVAADESEYVSFVEDADGAYTFEIAVEALNQELECTGFSKRKEKWYDHQILFEADTLPADALLIELTSETESVTEDMTEVSENTEPVEETQIAIVEQETTSLADGNYTIDVDLAGGSGRASITSPAELSVTGGLATATIEWSSPNYDYMIVNGGKYLPVNDAGNSVFLIPVLSFDKEMQVIADTVAMSTPHEVTYTLNFHTDSAQPVDTRNSNKLGIVVVAVAAVLLIAGIVVVVVRKKK